MGYQPSLLVEMPGYWQSPFNAGLYSCRLTQSQGPSIGLQKKDEANIHLS